MRRCCGGLIAVLFASAAPTTRAEPEVPILSGFDWENAVNLTRHPYWDFDPDFSPDGTRIAFHSNRPPSPGNRGQIWVMNADGSNPMPLTFTEGTNYGAVWSPDGAQIAFVSERDGDTEVYVMNADGSDQRNLTRNPDAYDSGPDWSPDGRRLAYFSGSKKPESDEWQPPGSPYRYWNSDLYVMDLETGESARITTADRDDIYPDWSRDGRRLVFTSTRDGNEEVYVVDADGTDLLRLTRSPVHDKVPAWLPGDTHISYRNSVSPDTEELSQIFVMEIATGETWRVTRDEGLLYFGPEVAPDGRSVIFSAFVADEEGFRGERADIYRVRMK